VADLTLLIFIAVDSLYVYMCMYLQHYNAFTVLLLCKFLFYFFSFEFLYVIYKNIFSILMLNIGTIYYFAFFLAISLLY